jgi:HEPN domain-containing protein
VNNHKLGNDYIHRAHGRLKAIDTLLNEKLFADVVRESQKACELALKGAIYNAGHSVPRIPEVSHTLEAMRQLKEVLKIIPR